MKALLILLFTFSALFSYATPVCAPCAKAGELVKAIEASGVKPDVANEATVDKQYEFINNGSKIISELLRQVPFKEEHVEATMRLAFKLMPYDVPLIVPEENVKAFQKVYKSNKALFTARLKALVKAGVMTEKEKKEVIAYMGAAKL